MTTKKKTADKAEAPKTQDTVSTASQQPLGLTIQDLVLVAQVIQTTSQRGAYRAEELANVGNLYNKLVTFLESVGAINRQPEETEEKSE